MKLLTLEETEDHFRVSTGHSLQSAVDNLGRSRFKRYGIPSDCGRKTALATLICETIKLPVVFFILQYDIWPSASIPRTFSLLRQAAGDSRSISQAPSHLFIENENELLSVFFSIALYFMWDVALLEKDTGLVVFASHEEFIEILDSDRDGQRLDSVFRDFGMVEI